MAPKIAAVPCVNGMSPPHYPNNSTPYKSLMRTNHLVKKGPQLFFRKKPSYDEEKLKPHKRHRRCHIVCML